MGPAGSPPLEITVSCTWQSGIGESTLAEWRGTHTGPAYVKSGRRVLYPKEAVLGFMRANLRECKEASA